MRSFTIDAQTTPVTYVGPPLSERLAASLAKERLAGVVVSMNALTRVISVRASIDAKTADEAFALGITRVRAALERTGLQDPDISEATIQQDLEADDFASARDDIVGTPDVARRLGVSRQRIAQLAAVPGRFPNPIATVRGTHVWRWGDIADWVAAGQRDTRRRAQPQADNTIDLMDALKRQIAAKTRPATRKRTRRRSA